MKKIFRMFIFSSLALYLTSLWNKGFILKNDPKSLFYSIVLIIALYYLAIPLTKLILLPLNIFTFGLVSLAAYFLVFYFVITHFPILTIKQWEFPGIAIIGISISKMKINYIQNVVASAFSLSFIINTLESIL